MAGDNELMYSRALHADPKNHLLFFRKSQGHQLNGLKLPAGKHQLRVRVQSPLGLFAGIVLGSDRDGRCCTRQGLFF